MHVHGLGTLLYCTSALLQELGLVRLLEKEEVQAGVAAANEKGDQEQASKSSPGGGWGSAGSWECILLLYWHMYWMGQMAVQSQA